MPCYKYVFRCMRGDGSDLDYDPVELKSPLHLRQQVALAVNVGSQLRSTFLHCSRSLEVAYRWLDRGRRRRGAKQNYLVRIDITGMTPLTGEEDSAYSQGYSTLEETYVIDMSSYQHQVKFLAGHWDDRDVQDHLHGIGMCT